MALGQVVQVMGPVVDVRFNEGALPEINNALTVQIDVADSEPISLTLEVALHRGDNIVRTIAMSSTDGLRRGAEVVNTGGPISVPVGEITLGRVFNVLGEHIDLEEPIPASERRDPIHRLAPKFEDLSTST